MPFYELRCNNCKAEFEARASMSDRVEMRIQCPECGSNSLEAVFKTAPAYIKNLNAAPGCPNSRSCGDACPRGRGN